MARARFAFTITIAVIASFMAGAAGAGWYFYGWVNQSTEDALVDRTIVLQYLRTGDIGDAKFAEKRIESIAWNQIISIGNRVAAGHPATLRASEAVTYHCSELKKQQLVPESNIARERAYWCECVLTMRCSGMPAASAER